MKSDLKTLLEKRKKEIKSGSFIRKKDEEEILKEKAIAESEEQKKKEIEKEKKIIAEKASFYATPNLDNIYLPIYMVKTKQQQQFQYSEYLKAKEAPKNSAKELDHKIPLATPLSKLEVVKRLRAKKEPITLFGETDWARYERLCKLEGIEPEQFLKDAQRQSKTELKMTEEEFKKMIEMLSNYQFDEDNATKILNERNAYFQEKNAEEVALMRKKPNVAKYFPYDEKCEDVLLWCCKMLSMWQKELMKRNTAEQDTVEFIQEKKSFDQCKEDINPLLYILMMRSVNDEILDSFFHIAHFCWMREYVRSHDRYLELAIGNAPWPMGVTMVGIHERSGRSKLSSYQIAHILNDETQRKYIQGVKRLVTVSQKVFPSDASKMFVQK